MVSRLEIRLKKELKDPEGASIKRKSREYFGIEVEDIRSIRILTIDSGLDADQLEQIRMEIFTNPVTEESSYLPVASGFDWIIWVGFRPGVRDTAGSTAKEAIEDILGVTFKNNEAVYTSKLYEIRGNIDKHQAAEIASELLANDIIQQWKIYSKIDWDPDKGIGFQIPKVILNHEPTVNFVPLGSDDELKEISLKRNLALQERDIPVIRNYFLREDVRKERKKVGLDLPTDVELEYISQARSDHCNHNTFKGLFRYHDIVTGHRETVDNLFKSCIEDTTLKIKKEKDWIVSVLWDNAGVGRFDDNNYYVITGETHNSPSNMEAYGGSVTGIVGVYRDPMGAGKGSRLILGMYGFCVGPREYRGDLRPHLHPRRLLDGVIEGVRDGGNKSGVPTPFGLVLFDKSYLGKSLVFVTAMGIMPAVIGNESSHKKRTSPGDLIVMSGGRVGKDGIHGVTAASETFTEHTPAGHVQIGDPYTQKKLHDFLLEARNEGLISFITDNGGGGLSSSIGESARFSNGCRVDLAKVPLKYEGLDQWEIWISESQERMTIAVKPEHLDRFMELSSRHAVESTVIGEYNDSGYLRLDYKNKTCAYINMDFLESGFPQWEFDAEWLSAEARGLTEPVLGEPDRHGDIIRDLLSRPNICSRNWISRQYDHEVGGGSVIKPLTGKGWDIPSDSVVIRPLLNSNRGIVVSQALNPFYSEIDTYHMTAVTIDEAVRRTLAVGGDPNHLGGVDNFCWPTIEYHPVNNPDGKYKAAQLVRANQALRDYCPGYGIPLLSGKDSMYIDGNLQGKYGEKHKISGMPTFLFTVCSVIEDVSRCITLDAKFPGDLVYILGETKDELGGSEYYRMMGSVGLNVPKVAAKELLPSYMALFEAVKEGLLSSCHAVCRGGLAVHLAMVAMAGELGLEISCPGIPASTGPDLSRLLYSESAGRFIITVAPDKRERFETLFSGLKTGRVGVVTESPRFCIRDGEDAKVIDEDVRILKDTWKKPFGGLI
ncbi:MAG: phosphoribosylformylglycinamidine synthase subunit PurS [Deltaproteobacteria bacterium]|nr:phosphoribosylformylglycinamidine synthase subunit PurS [Deltaproteobacteria bacterium]